ncbi:hypothetical protein BJF78_15995 [Pseudonocardia sp. CNS-139]|nr:hypothetical protein BJF78_15995 [Pseudonocardia sp. CNS-139]
MRGVRGAGAAVVPGLPAAARAGVAAVGAGRPPVLAVGRYHGPLRTALLRYKERGRRDLARPLAALLGMALDEIALPGAPLWLVPAPSRASAARLRGGDHVLRLCRATPPVRGGDHVLRLCRATPPAARERGPAAGR